MTVDRWLDGWSFGVRDATEGLDRAISEFTIGEEYLRNGDLDLLFADGYSEGYDVIERIYNDSTW